MANVRKLPAGQYEIASLPRFGLSKFATRFPNAVSDLTIRTGAAQVETIPLSDALAGLETVEQTADFHCVTTWTKTGLRWSGQRFSDFYDKHFRASADGPLNAGLVMFYGQDGYRTGLPLEDLLQPDVLLASRLDGEPLTAANGAPLRLIAPAHYGYKNTKHISRIELWPADHRYQPSGLSFMDHPRARVALEERGRMVPGWLLRRLYRPLVNPTIRRFERELRKHLAEQHRSPPDR